MRALIPLMLGLNACASEPPPSEPEVSPVILHVAPSTRVLLERTPAGAAGVPVLALTLTPLAPDVHVTALTVNLTGSLVPAKISAASLHRVSDTAQTLIAQATPAALLEFAFDAALSEPEEWLVSVEVAAGVSRGDAVSAAITVQEQITASSASRASDLVMIDGELIGPEVRVADLGWAPYNTTARPPARHQHAMVFEQAANQLLLFSGNADYPNATTLADTWTWDGVAWTQEQPGSSPTPRDAAVLAYDVRAQRAVLFGGYDGNATTHDTWVWDTDKASWDLVIPEHRPPARELAAAAYDPVRRQVVLFGGWAVERGVWGFDDMWAWTGADWVDLAPATRPSARSAHTMVLDEARQRVVLFGGFGASEGFTNDTWEWDGSTWTRYDVTPAPSARDAYSLYYDPDRGVSVLFGGQYNLSFLGDVWEWNGTSWQEVVLPLTPSARAFHRMVYDRRQRAGVLFGGVDNAGVVAGDMGLYGFVVTE
ncbi:MAG: hypothetical protein HYZ27_00100 [Deltaproteobacteria bacterium]|nr:hypothetical protein [Deltaproteobacteria bacterium]